MFILGMMICAMVCRLERQKDRKKRRVDLERIDLIQDEEEFQSPKEISYIQSLLLRKGERTRCSIYVTRCWERERERMKRVEGLTYVDKKK